MSDEDTQSDSPSDDEIIQEAMDFLRLSEEAEHENRANGLEAVRFRHGDQWPAQVIQSRQLEQRPCLTINKTDAYCLQVANQQRQQRPRIKVDPTNGEATKKTADVIKGMIRHIESARGGGDLAYDTAFDTTITMGWGYWRIMADYVRDDSFEQELYLAPIDNAFSCYRDPNSTMPDGSDQERFLITDFIPKKSFQKLYPGKDSGANFALNSSGDSIPDWMTTEDIRVAEFFIIRKKADTICQLSDGTKAWLSEIKKPAMVIDKRKSFRRVVWWYKLTALEVLERQELKGRYIPVVPMYGKVEVIDGKRKLSGLVKNAMDPQRQLNYWRTYGVESVALASKPKWLIAEGQDEGHEAEWATANTSSKPTLRYKPTDVGGAQVERPSRIQPEPPPQGAMAMAELASNDLSGVLGIVEPAMRIGGNVSGKALKSEKSQSDNSTFHYYDNMCRSMRFTGVILLDLIPYYYAEPGRIARIVGDDGRSKQVKLNEQNPSPGPETPGPIEEVLNDITVGEYDVVMDTGPGYNSKRIEAVDALMPLMAQNEELFNKAGDLLFRNFDFPGSEVIADRLAASNPLAQIDENSEIPPGVQMKIKQMEAQLQQQGQMLQAAQLEIKHKAGIEQMRQTEETKRTMIETTAKVHANDQDNAQWQRDTQANTETKRHDTEVRSLTALSVAEINAAAQLMKTGVDNRHELQALERKGEQEERQLAAKSNETEK